jgi:hypothetical protein
MKALTLWLQNNPMVILVMFFVAILSGIMTIILGWKAFYQDYLSKTITVPVWLLIILFFIACLLVVQFSGKESNYGASRELESIEGKRFGVQQVILDGKKFERCEFVGTELIFNGKAGFSLMGCKFSNQRFTFWQYASNTINQLTAMYQDPSFRPIIDQIIDNLKAGKHPQSIPVSPLNK